MRKMVKRAGASAVLGGSLLCVGGLGIASAAPGTDVNDQLVNLGVGNNANFIQDVNVDVAAQIAGLLCGTGVTGTANNPANGPSATGMANQANPNSQGNINQGNTNVRDIIALANQVDAGQIPTTTCESAQGVVTISQNGQTGQNGTANTPNSNTVPGQANTPNASNAPATGPNAENVVDQPTGSQPGTPNSAPMTPTSGPTPAS